MKTNRIMVGVLGGLGFAAGAHAGLCPPGECSGSSPGVAHVMLREEPVRTASPRMLLLETMVDGGLPQPADTVRWQPDTKVRSRTVTKSGTEDGGAYVIVNDKDTVAVTIENGKVVSLNHNGKKIPPEKVKKTGNKVTILGDSGETVYEFDLGEEAVGAEAGRRVVVRGHGDATGEGVRGFRFPRAGAQGVVEMNMEAPKAMIGVQLGEANGMLLGHFGIKPGEATLVTGVYDGLPAEKAGLKPYDLIVAVNDETPAGQTEVREALRGMEAGEKVRVTVIHRGERKNVELTLVEYNEEVLAESKLEGVEPDAMGFAFGSGSGENVFVAPGVGQLRNFQGQDAEKWREFAEAWRAQAEEFTKEFGKPGGRRAPDAFAAPTPPSAPVAPRGAAGAGANDARWQRIEERLERLEQMLERLAEQRGGGAGGGGR